MRRRRHGCALAVLGLVLLLPTAASAQPVSIADLRANPSRHWNLTVTVVGEVQRTDANPAGTTRGIYALVDDSGPTPILVRTTDLPPVGRTFSVVGVVVQDPASGAPMLKEVSRSLASPTAAPLWPTAPQPAASIADIFANPARYRNRTVTLVGQIQDVAARPAGTTRGVYTLVDDSGPAPIMVSTNDLPPVGRTFSVVGEVIQDPSLPQPVLKELSRSARPTIPTVPPPVATYPPASTARQAWIADILASPSRHWNLTVTLVGEVQSTTANPVGTTRGTYTLLDDSGPVPIAVRSADLPPVGRAFSVVGVVLQDPESGAPMLKEVSRSSARR